MIEINEPNRKHFGYKINILILLIFIVGVSSYLFRSQVGSIFWMMKSRSPIEWENLRIHFPLGIVYKNYDESVWFFQWDKTDGYLSMKKMEAQNFSRDYLVQFFEDKNYKVLEKKDIKFKENQGFIISYIDDSGTYNYNIYIAPKNLRFHYEGKKENYKFFKEIIERIEFL